MKTIEQLEKEKGTFSIETALSEGWKLVVKNLIFYILGALITLFISVGAAFIPIVGNIADSLILSPCLMGGGIYVTWRISQGAGWTDFADMFKGFNYLVPLMLVTLIQTAVVLGILALFLVNYIPQMIELYKLSYGTGSLIHKDEIQELVLGMFTTKSVLLFSGAMLAILFIYLIWSFKSHFVIIYKMQPWAAMEMSRKVVFNNFLPMIALFIILGVSVIISALPCGLGLFLTMPWMIGAVYSAFAQITQAYEVHDIKNEGFDFLVNDTSAAE